MANAKKLTEPQIAALRAAARGEDPHDAAVAIYRRSRTAMARGAAGTTIHALVRRGLLSPSSAFASISTISPTITHAGRHALFEATGENTALPEPAAPTALEVVEIGTGKVVHTVELHGKTPSQIERIEMGLLRNMDLDRFSVRNKA